MECSVQLLQAQEQIAQMEFLIAQALACCQRRERPSEAWEANAEQVLMLLREDEQSVFLG